MGALKTVLVVDDSVVTLHAAVEGLSEHYNVSCAKSGELALEFLSKRLKEKLPLPQMLLLDIYMPEMDGFRLFGRIRSLGIATPIAFMSGQADDNAKLRCIGIGAVGFITKPFRPQEMLELISEVIGE